MLDAIIIESPAVTQNQKPIASIIWLHGLGADGGDFAPIVPQLNLNDLAIRFIFPHAPTMPVTINNGYVMRAWYDIKSNNLTVKQDLTGTVSSQQAIETIIHHEIDNGMNADHIILAGFSQGGAVALYTGLRFPHTLGGIIALSTYLPFAENTKKEASNYNLGIPIFMAHGQRDPIIPMSTGEQSKTTLERLDYSVLWHDYPMEHSVHPEEILDIGNWIRKRIETMEKSKQ